MSIAVTYVSKANNVKGPSMALMAAWSQKRWKTSVHFKKKTKTTPFFRS